MHSVSDIPDEVIVEVFRIVITVSIWLMKH